MADISKIEGYNLKDTVARERQILVKSASGNIATFNDGGDNIPVKSLITEITAEQDLHGYDSPFPSGSTKNLAVITETTNTSNGVTYRFDDNGTVLTSGACPSGNSNTNYGHFLLPAGTYTLSGFPTTLVSTTARECALVIAKDAYSGSQNLIISLYSNVARSGTFTLTETTDCYLRIYVYPAAGTLPASTIFKVQVEQGDTATSFVPNANVCPIVGFNQVDVSVMGKNYLPMFTPTTASGINYTIDNNGIVTASGQATGNSRIAQYLNLSAGTYTLSGASSGSTLGVGDMYVTRVSDGVVIARDYTGITDTDKQFTLTQTERLYVVCRFVNAAMTSSTTRVFYPQIERGETASEYNPYTLTTHTITLPDTIYGGTADLTNGNGKKKKVLFTATWGDGAGSTDLGNNIRKYYSLPIAPETGHDDILCNVAPYLESYVDDSCHFYISLSNKNLYVYLPEGTSNDTVIQVAYYLATPTAFTFTPESIPTLSGLNNIYSNTGDVEVEYFNENADEVANLVRSIDSDYHIYSTDERIVGKWVDGKPIYEKTVECGAIPDGSSQSVGYKEVAHNISNLNKVIEIKGMAYSDTEFYPLPCTNSGSNSAIYSDILLYSTKTDIILITRQMWSTTVQNSFVTLRYTKS